MSASAVSVVTSQLPYLAGAVAGFWLSAVYLWRTLRHVFGDGPLRTSVKTLTLYAAMVIIETGLALAAGLWVARTPV